MRGLGGFKAFGKVGEERRDERCGDSLYYEYVSTTPLYGITF